MTLVSDIITPALRDSNIIAVGAAPTTDMTNEALARLQSILLSTLGNEIGYSLEDWDIKAADNITDPSGVPLSIAQAAVWTVAPQARLICNLTAATVVLLDPQPQDGQRVSLADAAGNFATYNLTLNGNGRQVDSAATKVFSTNNSKAQLLYRSDTANWHVISTLATGDTFPLPEEFDDFFITMLAMRLNPRYGKELSQSSQTRLEQQRDQIGIRYSQTRLRADGPGAGSNVE